ncbi:MAG: tetratricopeptide repeat protein, partial [Gammaproteobacteria bacterium]|nr:tetratricopeptide repeat protein [Gammaproteobacteria bacterium]
MSNPLTTNAPPQHLAPLPQVRPLHEAIALHQAGRLEEATELYRTILLADPHNAEANHNMGILATQINHPAAGLPFFSAALDADPTRARYWLSYIDALIQADQRDDARQILALAQQHGLQGAGVDALTARLEISDPIAAPTPPIEPQATQAKQAKERRSTATIGRATNTSPTEHEV